MRLIISTLVCATALGLASAPASAQTAKPQPAQQTSTPAKRNTSAKPAASKPARATTMRATGKLSTIDAGSKMLTLTTAKGSQQFMLGASTKIQEGSKSIDLDALQKMTGRNITVSYLESGGQKTVQSVHVAAAAAKTAKTSAKKS